jgi:hypothetical protein
VRLVRLISFALILSVAGLSSSFAVCVSACTDDSPVAAQSHVCHDQTGELGVTAGDGSCPHGPALAERADLTRDDRAPLTPAQPVLSYTGAVVTGMAARARLAQYPPDRPVNSPPILRI